VLVVETGIEALKAVEAMSWVRHLAHAVGGSGRWTVGKQATWGAGLKKDGFDVTSVLSELQQG
jgi:hypothetical protein